MLGYAEAQHRTVVIVDVAGFTAANRRGVHQIEIHKRLMELLTTAFDDAGIPWQDCDVEDRGDGKLILVPRDVFNIRLVDQLWSRLTAELRRYNALHSAAAEMQLRVAVHAGEVWRGPAGEVSPAINLTARIIEAAEAKSALRDAGVILALIASDEFYRDVIEPDPAAAPDLFRRIPVDGKQTQTHAWLRVSESLPGSAPAPESSLVHALLEPDDAATLRSLLAGLPVPHLPTLVQEAGSPWILPLPRSGDAWDSFVHLTGFNSPRGGRPPALVFVDLLARQVDRALGERLSQWSDEQARRLGLKPPDADVLINADSYDDRSASTWQSSLDYLSAENPAALHILQLCAFFQTAKVDKALLRPAALGDLPVELDQALRDPQLLNAAIRKIDQLALAKVDYSADTLELHGAVRAVLHERLTSSERARLTRLAEILEDRVGTDVNWSTDSPANIDLLKRDALAEVLAVRIQETRAREPRTSLLVHLDGAWGSGKSTLLNLLDRRLTAAGFLVVRFDAWKHSRLSPPWWALLTTVRREIACDRGWWARRWLYLLETAARAKRSGAPYLLALILLLIIAGGLALVIRWSLGTQQQPVEVLKVVVPTVAALGVLWTGSRVASRMLLWDSARGARLFEQSDTNPMARVTEHFDWILRRSCKPVVYFIDDLDRCKDEYVVELLEAAQTLVRDAPRMHGDPSQIPSAAYFVVAADGSWLRRAYAKEYSETDALGYQFLDKLFQLTVPMPMLSPTTQRNFLGRLLGLEADTDGSIPSQIAEARSRIEAATGDEELILDTLNAANPGVREAITTDATRAVAAAETRLHTEHALRKFAPLLSPNPRSTKLFLNLYTMMRAIRTLEGITVNIDTLALWTIIRIRWPHIADYLQQHPEAVKGILEPLWCSDLFPIELQAVARSEELRMVASHQQGGPLTPDAIRQCCGTT